MAALAARAGGDEVAANAAEVAASPVTATVALSAMTLRAVVEKSFMTIVPWCVGFAVCGSFCP
jgi:ethanolamine ammonia-lyase large subunit